MSTATVDRHFSPPPDVGRVPGREDGVDRVSPAGQTSVNAGGLPGAPETKIKTALVRTPWPPGLQPLDTIGCSRTLLGAPAALRAEPAGM